MTTCSHAGASADRVCAICTVMNARLNFTRVWIQESICRWYMQVGCAEDFCLQFGSLFGIFPTYRCRASLSERGLVLGKGDLSSAWHRSVAWPCVRIMGHRWFWHCRCRSCLLSVPLISETVINPTPLKVDQWFMGLFIRFHAMYRLTRSQ